mgnify:CR=1 FL=1
MFDWLQALQEQQATQDPQRPIMPSALGLSGLPLGPPPLALGNRYGGTTYAQGLKGADLAKRAGEEKATGKDSEAGAMAPTGSAPLATGHISQAPGGRAGAPNLPPMTAAPSLNFREMALGEPPALPGAARAIEPLSVAPPVGSTAPRMSRDRALSQ